MGINEITKEVEMNQSINKGSGGGFLRVLGSSSMLTGTEDPLVEM